MSHTWARGLMTHKKTQEELKNSASSPHFYEYHQLFLYENRQFEDNIVRIANSQFMRKDNFCFLEIFVRIEYAPKRGPFPIWQRHYWEGAARSAASRSYGVIYGALYHKTISRDFLTFLLFGYSRLKRCFAKLGLRC